jgi:hypothetical protein
MRLQATLVQNISYKTYWFVITIALILVLSGRGRAFAYYVSGTVEFTYRDLETRTGDVTSSDRVWTQSYGANMASYIMDPRIVRYNAGVRYNVSTDLRHHSQDSHSLDYDLSALFFPGMKFSGNAYARQSVQTFESANSIVGYDSEVTSYGGSISLNLARAISTRRNNNADNNNDNNNLNRRNGGILSNVQLPNIVISRDHVESQSLSFLSPRHETRDNTSATLYYRPASSFDLSLSSGLEQYKNLLQQHGSYDARTTTLTSTYLVNPDADLRVDGNFTDRTFDNIAGSNAHDQSLSYGAKLNFKEKDRISHYYTYSSGRQKSSTSETDSQIVAAGMSYKITDALHVTGGGNYGSFNFTQKATARSDIKTSQESGGAQGGVSYAKAYTPSFLGPFTLQTRYGLSYGFNKYSSSEASQPHGSGSYYENQAALGLNSQGWQQENLSLNYNYSSKRDQSPVHNDTEQQSLGLNFMSRRVTKTVIRANATYFEQKSNSLVLLNSIPNQATFLRSRSFVYNLGADYTATDNVMLSTGATRAETNTSAYSSSLATQAPPGLTSTNEVLYGSANLTYPISRHMQYRANVRDEYTKTENSQSKVHKESYILDMFLDYRIRQVLIALEARWREDMPSNAQKSQQQYFFVRLTRSF